MKRREQHNTNWKMHTEVSLVGIHKDDALTDWTEIERQQKQASRLGEWYQYKYTSFELFSLFVIRNCLGRTLL